MRTISEIKEMLKGAEEPVLSELMEELALDPRKGVAKLLLAKKKELAALAGEKERVEALCAFEKEHADVSLICGIDEVGRGPLAGPVVAGAVILPKDCRILYINDSKKLSAKKREELDLIIRARAISVGIGLVPPERIDEINILNATYEAMRMAIDSLPEKPGLLLNDAVTIPGITIPQLPIIGGDGKSISIAAASIVAKVYRDRLMEDYDRTYPGYGFASNKGYGSKDHMRALKELGPCPIHRRSFIHNIDSSDKTMPARRARA